MLASPSFLYAIFPNKLFYFVKTSLVLSLVLPVSFFKEPRERKTTSKVTVQLDKLVDSSRDFLVLQICLSQLPKMIFPALQIHDVFFHPKSKGHHGSAVISF